MINDQYSRQATDGVMLEASFVLEFVENFGAILAQEEDSPERGAMLYVVERVRSGILEASANAWRLKYQSAFDLPGEEGARR